MHPFFLTIISSGNIFSPQLLISNISLFSSMLFLVRQVFLFKAKLFKNSTRLLTIARLLSYSLCKQSLSCLTTVLFSVVSLPKYYFFYTIRFAFFTPFHKSLWYIFNINVIKLLWTMSLHPAWIIRISGQSLSSTGIIKWSRRFMLTSLKPFRLKPLSLLLSKLSKIFFLIRAICLSPITQIFLQYFVVPA